MNSIEPKIAVYSIALNEEKHVRRWYESAREADLVLLADTGSSDKTIPIAKSLGVTTYSIDVNPWRFDVARNASLALIPEDFDICIQLDLDEVLPEAWRGVVTQAWRKGNYWPTYKHVTSRYRDGKARDFQHYFKIHPRNGFFWKYPIHEILVPNDGANFSRELIDLEVDHLKDHSKSRGNYLHLLELAVSEMPNDWRMNHYLCREYMYNRNWLRVLQTAYASLELTSTWDVETASTCMWASEAAWNLGMKPLAEEWAQKGTDAAPNFYEAWHWRAHIAHLSGNWQECFEYSSKIELLSKQNHHLVNPGVWEWWGYDLQALSLHKLGFDDYALKQGIKAVFGSPSDERLIRNCHWYLKSWTAKEINFSASLESTQEKLKNLPRIYLLNLDESPTRLQKFIAESKNLGVVNWERIGSSKPISPLGIVPSTGLDKSIHQSMETGYSNAIRPFLNSGEEYCLICEDDINLGFAKYWGFTWEQKMGNYRRLQFDAIQLSLITSEEQFYDPKFHLRKEGMDWSSGATLLSTQGAKKILEKLNLSNSESPFESIIYDGLKVFTEALFTCDLDENSTLHQDHVPRFHIPSWTRLKSHYKNFDIELLQEVNNLLPQIIQPADIVK